MRRLLRRIGPIGTIGPILLLLHCGLNTETQVVTGQISRMMDPPFSSASVILGKATVSLPDVAPTPDPWDTSFSAADVPLWLTPTSGATVTVNGVAVPQRISGIYFTGMDQLEFMHPYDLNILVNDPKFPNAITGHAVLPDSFGITRPMPTDSLGYDTLRVYWSRSDSAQIYTIEVSPEDTTSRARGYLESLNDTTVLVPKTAFEDSTGNQYLPGIYVVMVSAVNGGWKRGIDVLLNGGNVRNAVGIFGAATYPAPVRIRLY